MKVFISWSGERSKAVAEILCEWIQWVLQASNPWMSSNGIERGAIWFNSIMNELADTNVGIFCLTRENKDKPWILFEAGALTKGHDTNKVCTFLIDLQPTDLESPLSHFNHTLPTETDLWKLVLTLNSHLGSAALKEPTIRAVFDTYWPKFEERFQAAITKTEARVTPPSRTQDEILREILTSTRSIERAMRNLPAADINDSKRTLFSMSPDLKRAVLYAKKIAATEGLNCMHGALLDAGFTRFITNVAINKVMSDLNRSSNEDPMLPFPEEQDLPQSEQP